MPVEIRELVIRTAVEKSNSSGSNGVGSWNSQESLRPAQEGLSDDIVRQIMDNLKRQKER